MVNGIALKILVWTAAAAKRVAKPVTQTWVVQLLILWRGKSFIEYSIVVKTNKNKDKKNPFFFVTWRTSYLWSGCLFELFLVLWDELCSYLCTVPQSSVVVFFEAKLDAQTFFLPWFLQIDFGWWGEAFVPIYFYESHISLLAWLCSLHVVSTWLQLLSLWE